ncbi:MAG: hypothetical protein ABFE07_00395 [Armatimonadia bacterium]
MADRIALALAACEGLTNEELAARGAGSFKKMIRRKRMYATVARGLAMDVQVVAGKLAKAQDEAAKAKATASMLESLDAPITDTSQAQELLASALQKGG